MSTGQLARNRSLSTRSDHSANRGGGGGGGGKTLAEVSMDHHQRTAGRDFEPSAATASMFLYAQGNSVICAHHDTLKIERVFSRHQEEIQLLAVDTVSDRGAGRLVVSYDAGQTAIVWDCMTGDEIARFASYENLTVAAWMRNGNVAFGNSQGNVILFEPTTSEHISARTIDQIPITALAPAADCRTYAIGFSNGSLLIAALQPRFTILHNLTTSRGPSPIVTLAWHASSSRQKSDMLATQTNDGDLRVWSIAKSPTSSDTAKVVRVLKRSDNFHTGPNWLGWSKNGRIIQFSESEACSWDVRTKHVTYETIPIHEHCRGLAIFGPGAALFTLGPNHSVQQFDIGSPPQMVANVQHTSIFPPSPPVSIEEQKQQEEARRARVEISAVPINLDISESDSDRMSPLARIAREMDKLEQQRITPPDRSDALSPASSRSVSSVSSRSSAESRPYHYPKHRSGASRSGMSDGTTMSYGSSLHSSREQPRLNRDSYSMSSTSSAYSGNSYGNRSRHKSSRLRQEVLRSPEESGMVVDLFRFTTARLSDIPYRHPQAPDTSRLTNDDLRRQMLSTIFGWDEEVGALIQDEMGRHPLGSINRVLLAKWMGDIDTDIMSTSSESMTSSDWMLLALSGIGGHASQTKVARAYVSRLLEKGDVHTAATIMIGMGDQNDAIEIYVSHKRYMEALILTCHVFPSDWSRQAELIRKWGEWAVQHNQQQLAIRCFSCTGSESSEPWFSPSAQKATFSNIHGIPELLSPPLSPPGSMGPQRSIAKTSALKLITTFGDKAGKSKFFGAGDDERTPMGGVTPIADSALSPGGDATAFLRPGRRSVLNTPVSARTATPGGFRRQRLASIGEMPSDVIPRVRLEPLNPQTPDAAGSERERRRRVQERNDAMPEPLQLSSATYAPARSATTSPMVQRTKTTNPLPSPSPEGFTTASQDARTRNGSRHRKPDGLQIQWPPMESIITGDYMTSPEPSATSSRYNPPQSGSLASVSSHGGRSPMVSERSYRSGAAPSPVVGRSLDQYISSLESAQHHKRTRKASADKHGRAQSSSRRSKTREASRDRGRTPTHGYIKPGKRSPTSPVPMSPQDLIALGSAQWSDDGASVKTELRQKSRNESRSKAKGSRASSRVRRASPEAMQVKISSRPSSRAASRSRRAPSPDNRTAPGDRGRSAGRTGSAMRSPSSPLPMSPEAKFYQPHDDDDFEDLKRAKADHERFRSRQRSSSRMRERGTSATRGPSPRRVRDRSNSRRPAQGDGTSTPYLVKDRAENNHSRSERTTDDGGMPKDERTLKKEQAARELEERRRSLAQRSVPPIHPEELVRMSPRSYISQGMAEIRSTTPNTSPNYGSKNGTPAGEASEYFAPQIGLPATPRAMRHPRFDDRQEIPQVPQIPEKYEPLPTLGAATYHGGASLAPLPKTVYQAAPRRVPPPRSASAPIPEDPSAQKYIPADLPMHPAFQNSLSANRRRTPEARGAPSPQSSSRKSLGLLQTSNLPQESSRSGSPVYSGAVTVMSGIEETIEASNDHLVPPPPPPAPMPPILRELQHLAMPPPPPPAPLYRPGANDTNSMISGVSQVSSASGTIEIVMDDDQPTLIPALALEPPLPLKQRASIMHSRGRSETESISNRISRAADRFRSASRGRDSPNMERTKSPLDAAAPYESVPANAVWSQPLRSHSIPMTTGSVPTIPLASDRNYPREPKSAGPVRMDGGYI